MKADPIAPALDRLAAQPGIVGCALVERRTGMVWYARGASPGGDSGWEAAVDYWRLHERQAMHFPTLGPLGAVVAYHRQGVLAVLPCCDDPALVVAATGTHRGVDWVAMQRLTQALGAEVARISAFRTEPTSHASAGPA